MRGLLACVVMFFHLGLNTVMSKLTWDVIDRGVWMLCVDFFFILSGFVLAYSFGDARPSPKRFAIKRIARLAPVFLFATAIMFLLTPTATSGWIVVANLLIVQSLIGVNSINFPGWSVPFELFFPIIALFLWPLVMRSSRGGLTVCVCAGSVAAVLLAQDIDIPVLRAAAGLGAGFCLFLVKRDLTITRRRPALALSLFSAAMLIMVLAAKMPLLGALFYPTSALSIVFGSQVRTVLSTWPFQTLGRWSYSIYLLHVPVLTAANVHVGQEEMSGNLPAKVGVIAATISAAGAMYILVEKPMMQLGRGVLAESR
jgi:peptidoglycan/LPS O-acetylase OafA/YrhL